MPRSNRRSGINRVVVQVKSGWNPILQIVALAAIIAILASCSNTYVSDGVDVIVSGSPIEGPEAAHDVEAVATDAFVLAVVDPDPAEVAFYLNDQDLTDEPLAVESEAPFGHAFDASGLDEGTHVVTAVVTRAQGEPESTHVEHVPFQVKRGSADPGSGAAPGGGSGGGAAPGSGSGGYASLSLRGNPAFDESSLSSEARTWYRRLLLAIEHPDRYPDIPRLADDACLYKYGRSINEYVTALMFGFRATGDLRLLDEADRVAQEMRSQLQTRWKDASGSYYTPDDGTAGLERWLWMNDENHDKLYGRDTHEMDALMTHGMIAMLAYAYESNRDLDSPRGIDYGERADFWRDYLRNDFEKIWRIRTGTTEGFPLLRRNLSHPWASSIRYHHFMGLLTGDGGYAREVEYLVDKLMDDQIEISTGVGPAYVWAHGLIAGGSSNDWLQGTIYVKYDLMFRAELVLEGVAPAIDADHMQKIANALSQFVDDGDKGNTGLRFAASVGGDGSRGGLRFRDGWRKRESEQRWAVSGLAFGAVWDETGLVDAINDDVYAETESDANNPRRVQIPAAKLLMYALR